MLHSNFWTCNIFKTVIIHFLSGSYFLSDNVIIAYKRSTTVTRDQIRGRANLAVLAKHTSIQVGMSDLNFGLAFGVIGSLKIIFR
jgi:hypothetical protein